MIAGQTTSTPSIVNPRGRCSFNIIHRTNLRTLATLDTDILINAKLLICNHPLIKIAADDIGIESGSGSFLQFLDTTMPFLYHLDDMGHL